MLAQIIVSSLVLGAAYSLIGVAWTIPFMTSGVLNFATGQLLLVAGLIYYTLTTQLALNFALSVAATLAAASLIAVAMYAGLLRRMAGSTLFAPVILTLGLAIVLGNGAVIIWGGEPKTLPAPFPNSTYLLPFGVTVTKLGALTVVTAAVFFALLAWTLSRTRLGTQMRAVAEAPVLAARAGVNVSFVTAVAWTIAGTALALAAITYGQANLISPAVAALGLRGVAPAMLGGLNSVTGLLVAAFIVALMENVATATFGGTVSDAVAWSLIFVVLLVRPSGLFGSASVERA
jgi:branched-chain amino acid transport system permease protein